jgi:NAD(P)-dependent dehydrogenase (short-subunit alcohol dehydrogenase family)
MELFSSSRMTSTGSTSSTTTVAVLGIIAGSAVLLLLSPRRRGRTFVPQHAPQESAVLITGGSRGIGRSTADYLASRGYTVIVTVRTQAQCDELENNNGSASSKQDHKLFPVILDVTNDSHVAPAVDRVQAILAQQKGVVLRAIVNNAGINPEADEFPRIRATGRPIENKLADPAVASRVLETNVVGVARVTRAFLPLLPISGGGGGGGGGRIVNIGSYFGSIAGKVGLAHAYYESSKFALEGLSDNMRRALSSQGIMVSLIKPGNISTDMNSIGEVGPEVVAQDIEHAIASRHPLPRYYPGKVKGLPTRLPCWIFEMLPTWLTDKLS